MSILDSMPEWKSGPFTDNDLKRLKEDTERTLSGVYLTKAKIFALLARLEAAEAVADQVETNEHTLPAIEVWRKSKGDGE